MRSALFLILFFAVAFSVTAQNMAVKSFSPLTNDLTAQVTHPQTDQNGQKAALIKVVTTQTGFDFDGGMLGIVKVEQKTAEVWVYVPNKAKALTIKHPQLGVIRSYAYPIPIEAGRTYELVLVSGTVETIVKPTEIETQWLAITTTPEGANVFIEEQLVGTTPFSRKYPEGEYTYRVELPRYHSEAGKLTLKAERKTLTLTMRPRFGNISVSSTPESGMMIYLNDENTGKTTPTTLTAIASGSHTLKLMNQWYQPQAQSVTVADNQTATANFNMHPAFADITVTTTPAADILIDGTRKGSGTHTARMLAGIYTVKAELSKHHPAQQQITVLAGKPQTIALSLSPQLGKLDVASTPFDAKITLNGKEYGTTPNTIKDLLVGEYTLVLAKTGFGTVTRTVTITEGKIAEVTETLPSGTQISINSTPAGAQLTLNGVYAGTTPYNATLGFGTHTLKLVNGKKEVTETITLAQGGKNRWDFDVADTAPGYTEKANNLNLEMVFVKGGTFTMGDTFGDGESDEKPTHSVTLSNYYMGKYEVTQAQWQAVMGNNPSDFKGCSSCPVESVSWNDVRKFLRKLNQQTGKKYRLPTEAEWEYAARGGASTGSATAKKYAGSNNIYEVAWYDSNSGRKTQPVGGKKANELGLYDMSGNVWEWCADHYGTYTSSSQTNPQGEATGSFRVFRGGSYYNNASDSRVAIRNYFSPVNRYHYIGFRLVLVP